MTSFVFVKYLCADGVIYFGFFDILTARGVGRSALASNNRSLMPLCPLSQPVSPFPCYVLAWGALGKMRGIQPVLFFPMIFPSAITYGKLLFHLDCQRIISKVYNSWVTESLCSSVVSVTLIYLAKDLRLLNVRKNSCVDTMRYIFRKLI